MNHSDQIVNRLNWFTELIEIFFMLWLLDKHIGLLKPIYIQNDFLMNYSDWIVNRLDWTNSDSVSLQLLDKHSVKLLKPIQTQTKTYSLNCEMA